MFYIIKMLKNDVNEILINKSIKLNIFATYSTFIIIISAFIILSCLITYYYYLIQSLQEISLKETLDNCNNSGLWICPIMTSILIYSNFLFYFEFPVYNSDYYGEFELIIIIFRLTFGKILSCTINIILLMWNVYEFSSNCINNFNLTYLFIIYIINISVLSIFVIILLYFIYKISYISKKEFYDLKNKTITQIMRRDEEI